MDNFEALLKEKGLTKTAFSDLLGIKKQNLNGLMKNPTLETIKRFATTLDVPMWQLFASSQEVQETKNTITCPQCGKPIELKVK